MEGRDYTLPTRVIPVGDPHWPQGRASEMRTAFYTPYEVETMQGLAKLMRGAEKAGDRAAAAKLKDEMLAIHELKTSFNATMMSPADVPPAMKEITWGSSPAPVREEAPPPVAASHVVGPVEEVPQQGHFARLWQERQASKPVARSTDPSTSHAAAASIASEDVRVRQQAILSLLEEYGPRTDEEIAVIYEKRGYSDEHPKQSPSGLRTRRSELHDAGFVKDTGEKCELESGRMGIVWSIA